MNEKIVVHKSGTETKQIAGLCNFFHEITDIDVAKIMDIKGKEEPRNDGDISTDTMDHALTVNAQDSECSVSQIFATEPKRR